MESPADVLLVFEKDDGTKGYINLWEAITSNRLSVKGNPLNRFYVIDACADCPENRHDIDTNFGTKEEKSVSRKNWVHHVDYFTDGTLTVWRHDGRGYKYHPTPSSLQRLESAMCMWRHYGATKDQYRESGIKDRVMAPMRRS